jgi:Flp pilus assembly protein TadG
MSAFSPLARCSIGRFFGDRGASVALTFAFAILPIMALVGAAMDYARALNAKSAAQAALDGSVLQAVTAQSTANASDKFLAGATGAGVSFGAPSFTTNADGSITATVRATVATSILSVIGVPSIAFNLSSTAKLTHPLTPHSITYQFQYAKGWYYKVITLYVQQTSTGAALPLATWTYQVTNDSVVAIPNATVPYFWSGANPPTDTGIGVVTTSWNATNAATIGATLDSTNNTITFNQSYYNLYLTMNVANQKCPLGQASYTTDVAPTASQLAFLNSVYGSMGSTDVTVGCRSPIRGDSTPLSSWSKTISTNSATSSNYLYINGVEQQANIAIGLLNAFPCASAATGSTSVTNDYEWEDSSTSATGTRDFFFSLTTTCATNQWSNAPNIATLSR